MMNRQYFLDDIDRAAKGLLGSLFIKKTDLGKELSGRIVEVEVYTQKDDPASHSYKGQTKRNAVMFGPPGYLYVYFTYGMHYCCNIVCGPEGRGDAILIRGVEPVDGIDTMMINRYGSIIEDRRKYNNLTNGPAKLCRALGIDMTVNGADLFDGALRIEHDVVLSDELIGRSTRIGISSAADQFKRYFIKGNNWVSKAGKGIKYYDK